VHLAPFPEPPAGFPDEALLAKYEFLFQVRDEINRGLEEARKAKVVATAQEARVTLTTPNEDLYNRLSAQKSELELLSQTPEVDVEKSATPPGPALKAAEISGLFVRVAKARGEKCIRCWFHLPSVGEDAGHPQVCARCRSALEG
jgi:isoleucyl-tRNA synthetase